MHYAVRSLFVRRMALAMDTELKHWQEWKKECNLRVCGDETKVALLSYVGERLHGLVSWAIRSDAGKHDVPHESLINIDGWMAWDRFEGFYLERGARTGKVYKDWIFLTAQNSRDDQVDELERRTYLLLRNVAREYIQECYPLKKSRSLDAPLNTGDPNSPTLMDLLSDDSSKALIEARDLTAVAKHFTSRFFDEMSLRERVVIAAVGLGLPASCAEAEAAARCKKSMLGVSREQVGVRLKGRLGQEMPEDAMPIRFYVVEALVARCIEWAKGEKSCEPIFHLLAKRQTEGGRP